MEALLTAFIAAGLGEWGDKTQLLTIALVTRFRRPGAVLAGLMVAALANSLISAFGGTLIHGTVTPRAVSLFLAVALLFAGVAGLIGQKPKEPKRDAGAFLTSTASLFLAGWGDKTQFITAALAAQFDTLALTGLGAAAGIVAANLPAVALGNSLRPGLLKGLRIAAGLLFLLVGVVVGVNALRLV